MTAIENAGEKFPLPELRNPCSAGEPLNPEVIRWFREQYGHTVLDYYGLTESYPLCGNFPTVEVREGSMGRPMPGWEVAILDEDENELPVGERGEICLRARSNPHYPIGYWNRPEDTKEDFEGDWFHTKDAAELDDDGYVWYAGRADDVIISAGYRIGPFEVESACVEHPAVREAAAVASPDPKRGDIVKAFVILAEGHEASDEKADEIKTFVRGHLSAFAYPREIEFVDDLPKTLTGQDPPDRAARGRAREEGPDDGLIRAPAPAGCRRGSPTPRSRRAARSPIRLAVTFCHAGRASTQSPPRSPQMITFSSSRSARSNSSARKLSPIRITRNPGPGTPGPGQDDPAEDHHHSDHHHCRCGPAGRAARGASCAPGA